MKYKWKMLPIILSPYIYMFCLLGAFIAYSNSTVPGNAAINTLISMLIIAVACSLYSLIVSISLLCSSKNEKPGAKELAKMNMIIKLAQIPAYIFHFCLGLAGLLMSVWGIPVILWAVFVDFISIIVSGIVSVSANISGKNENVLTSRQAVLFSISGFVFCVDVVISIVLYSIAKRKNSIYTSKQISVCQA